MSQERRAIRHVVSVPGRYRMGRGIAKDVKIIDISEMGCRFFDRFGSLQVGTEISVRIGSIGPIVGTVRWADQQEVGVEFEELIYGPVLEHIRSQLSANRVE